MDYLPIVIGKIKCMDHYYRRSCLHVNSRKYFMSVLTLCAIFKKLSFQRSRISLYLLFRHCVSNIRNNVINDQVTFVILNWLVILAQQTYPRKVYLSSISITVQAFSKRLGQKLITNPTPSAPPQITNFC